MRTPRTTLALLTSAALLLAACGGGDEDKAGAGGGGASTGPGVTADTITLGSLTDGSGPFKTLSLNIRAGEDLWVADTNAAGGVCGRQLKVEVRDHGYKADQAKILFADLEPKVAGFLELLGSPMIAALGPDIEDKKVTSVAVSWSSELLDQPYVLIAGTTYDLEIINALSYLLQEKKIASGDTIGHIYIDGEYGGNGLRGSTFFAERHKLKLVEAKVTPTDSDMKGIVTRFKGQGVKAIALTTTGAQTSSAAAANEALGLKVPLVGNAPVFTPALMDGPGAAGLSRLYLAASTVPFDSADVPGAKAVAEKYKAAYPNDLPSYAVNYGYAVGLIWQQILQKACESGGLTRDGIFAAKNASTTVDTKKLIADLDLSKLGSPPTREAYIATPDKESPGRLKQVGKLAASEDAAAYKAPKEAGP